MGEPYTYGPITYADLIAVDTKDHQAATVSPERGREMARAAQHAPIVSSEFLKVACDFPIVFLPGDNPMPMAIISLSAGYNPFLTEDGDWDPLVYTPAVFRRYPFILADFGGDGRRALAVDSAALAEGDGWSLFTDGEESEELQKTMKLCRTFDHAQSETLKACKRLKDEGLLKEQAATLRAADGVERKMGAHQIVDLDALRALPDEKIADLQKAGLLMMIHAHIVSLEQMRKIASMS
ncbi:MAG: SapC family protein [Pseudomonadota bacterium]